MRRSLFDRRPLSVILDTTEKCNLKCRMCHFSATDRLQFPPNDVVLSDDGMMPVEVFERVAEELFPRAWRVALACAAEPLIHPRFLDIVRIAGQHEIPDLWFPTNLLALTRAKAEAICAAGVTTVGVSIDGTHQETYEDIRVGGKFARLEKSLTLLNEVRGGRRGKTGIRIIFTWMKSNRQDLPTLPAFAERWGANELDVRFVTPTPGVDNGPELLEGEDPAVLRAELSEVAHDAVSRGIRLGSYPDFEAEEDRPKGIFGRYARWSFRRRAGIDRLEYARYRWLERMKGCVWPSDFYVVRPNGAVLPCIFWDRDPIGFFPHDDFEAIASGEALRRIRDGLSSGEPVGTCTTCSQRKDAFYYKLRKGRRAPEQDAGREDLVQIGPR